MLMKVNKKLFTILVALFPLLNRYSSGIPYLTLSEVLALIITFFSLLLVSQKFKVEKYLLIFCMYLIIEIILAIVHGISSFDLMGSTLRLFFYYAIVAFFAQKMFDLEQGKHLVIVVALATGIYAIMQVLFAYLGVYLPTYISFLNLMSGGNTDSIVIEKANYGMRYRPYSIFNEPAQLCSSGISCRDCISK